MRFVLCVSAVVVFAKGVHGVLPACTHDTNAAGFSDNPGIVYQLATNYTLQVSPPGSIVNGTQIYLNATTAACTVTPVVPSSTFESFKSVLAPQATIDAFFAANPSFTNKKLDSVQLFNTPDASSSILVPFRDVGYFYASAMSGVTYLALPATWASTCSLSLGFPDLKILEWYRTTAGTDCTGFGGAFSFSVGTMPAARLFNLSNLIEVTDAGTSVSFAINDANMPNLMAVDMRKFLGTGITNVLTYGPGTVNAERIRLDSIVSAAIITMPVASPRFANSFPLCQTVYTNDVTTFKTQCQGDPAVPDHDYYTACIAPITGGSCADSSAWNASCWIATHTVSAFSITRYPHADLSQADCVLDSNYYFTVTDMLTIQDSPNLVSLEGIPRVLFSTVTLFNNTALEALRSSCKGVLSYAEFVSRCVDAPAAEPSCDNRLPIGFGVLSVIFSVATAFGCVRFVGLKKTQVTPMRPKPAPRKTDPRVTHARKMQFLSSLIGGFCISIASLVLTWVFFAGSCAGETAPRSIRFGEATSDLVIADSILFGISILVAAACTYVNESRLK